MGRDAQISARRGSPLRSDRGKGVELCAAGNDADVGVRGSVIGPKAEDVGGCLGEADDVIGLLKEVRFPGFEVTEDRTEQGMAEVPQAAVHPLVRPEAAHVEEEARAMPALHAEPGQRRDVAAAVQDVERTFVVQALCQSLHGSHVAQGGQDRRTLCVGQRISGDAGVVAVDSYRGQLRRASFRLLEADQRDVVAKPPQSDQIRQDLGGTQWIRHPVVGQIEAPATRLLAAFAVLVPSHASTIPCF